MPKGTPLTAYCRKCRKGYNPRDVFSMRGRRTRRTGRVERKVTRSANKGFGGGGETFWGHRGEMECLDCRAKWFSTHPDSGRLYRHEVTAETWFA